MAIKERTSHEFMFCNPLLFLGLHNFRIETPEHPNGEFFRFAQFEWEGREYWFMPRATWYNRLDCGKVHVRLKGGRKLYSTSLLIRPGSDRHEIPTPHFPRFPTGRTLIIVDLPQECVEPSFLRFENKRLWGRPPTHSRIDVTRIVRPPSGYFV
jgi:hypothetical protein